MTLGPKPKITLAVLVLVSAGLAAMTVSARSRTGDVLVLKLAHGLDVTHPVHKAMELMARRIEEKSDGQVRVEIFPSEQLGSERVLIEQTQMGLIDMTKTSAAVLEQFVPRMAVFGVPYVFRDEEHYWKVLDGELGRELLADGQGKGLKGLCYFDAGSRSFYTKDRPIRRPEDLAGLKIRVQQSNTAIAMVRQLGGSPTAIDWGELYTSLQQGVVDGAENNPPSFETSRHYEVCRFYSLDQHTQVPDVLLVSKLVWDKLPPDVQQIVQEAADEASRYERELWSRKTRESLDAVKRAGVQVIYPDKRPFAEKVKPMHQSYRGTPVGDLLDEIRKEY